MNDSPEYIEAYFEKQLSETEMRQFERRCEQDNLFAQNVASYITTREAVKQLLAEQKKEQWRTISQERTPAKTSPAPVRTMFVRRWLPYASAACLILFITFYFFNAQSSLGKQVDLYIENETAALSPQMGLSGDSLEMGIRAYNVKDYKKAQQIFSSFNKSHQDNQDALLYTGCTFLRQKKYDEALMYFQQLSGFKLYSNKGPFYTALTLLERNKTGDKEKAKQVLQTVLSVRQYDNKKEAQTLLDLMK